MENLKYTEILQYNKELASQTTSQPYGIAVLSNVTINSIKEILEYSCRVRQIHPLVDIGNFDNIVQDSATFTNKDLVIIFYDTLNIVDSVSAFFEDLSEQDYGDLKQKIYSEIDLIFENLKDVPSVIFNSFSSAYFLPNYVSNSRADSFVVDLNSYLELKKKSNTTIVNIDKLFVRVGLKQAIDYRFYNSSKAPYTFLFLKSYVSAIETIFLRNVGKLKKALIFDCDNTLWKGILGEDGMDGIDMSPTSPKGKYYHSIQQMALFLSKKGIIIGICSKNNEADVLEVFQNHKDMVLKEENIVIKQVNWLDKATNLKAIAEELNIGLDSLVFVDDSPFEINLIRKHLPEILALQVPENISDYPNYLLQQIYTNFNLKENKDDVKKTEMYKQNIHREENKSSFGSIEDYLASLGIEITVYKNDISFVPRISQLTQKTNQFNLTTLRYTESQIEKYMTSENSAVFAISVNDKFGDNGMTGVCIVVNNDSQTAIIDTYLLSCRVIGRNIEYVFFNEVVRELISKGFKTIQAKYIPSAKNAQVEKFFEQAGMHFTENTDEFKLYSLELEKYKERNLDYIKVNRLLSPVNT